MKKVYRVFPTYHADHVIWYCEVHRFDARGRIGDLLETFYEVTLDVADAHALYACRDRDAAYAWIHRVAELVAA